MTHLGEHPPECGVPLLSHPGLLVLLILGQLFPFEEQLSLKLRLGLDDHFQLPQGHAEAKCFLGLPALILVGVGEGSWD